jgi:hypothetical protein
MYNSNTVSYTIDNTEYGYNVDKPSIFPTVMKAYIPALMPYITMGMPAFGKVSVNKTIFVNDSSCKVNPSAVMTTQNYLTITKWKNTYPYFPEKEEGTTGKCVRYSKFMFDIFNGDIRNMHISNHV